MNQPSLFENKNATNESTQKFTVYRSSAGSGKTFTLTGKYISTCLSSEDPSTFKSILAITFTNKAAKEMKERVIEGLRSLTLDSDHPDKKSKEEAFICKETELDVDTVREKAKRVLHYMIHNYTDISISTIDQFVYKIVAGFATDLHLPPEFEVEVDQDDMLQKSVDLLVDECGNNDAITKTLIDFSESKAGEEKSWHIENDLYEFSKKLLDEEGQFHVNSIKNLEQKDFKNVIAYANKRTIAIQQEIKSKGNAIMEILANNDIHDKDLYQGKRGIYGFYKGLADCRDDKVFDAESNSFIN
ncbi:MAG: UvrD-helicase domain-containing protein, partial [Flavobacteriales bacterium]